MNYFIADGTNQRGPFPKDQLMPQGLRPDMMVWCEGMAQWQRADQVDELRTLFPAPVQPTTPFGAPAQQSPAYGQPYPGPPQPTGYAGPGPMYPPYSQSEASSKKIAAGICGILLGWAGIHKFVLGMTGPGLIMLLTTVLTCGFAGFVFSVIGIVEGIIYLTKSDEDFYRTYMVEKRAWF